MPLALPAGYDTPPPSAFTSEDHEAMSAGSAQSDRRKGKGQGQGLSSFWKYGPLVANLADAGTTAYAVSHGAREADPALEPFAHNPAALVGVMAAKGLTAGLLADWLAKRGHPTLGKIASGLNIAIPLGTSTHNLVEATR